MQQSSEAQGIHRPSRSFSRRARWWLAVSAVAVVLVVIGAIYLAISQPLIDRKVVADAGFAVYVPSKLPSGYHVDRSATVLGGNTLTYVLNAADSGKSITLTVQPMPRGFDISKMVDKVSIQSTATTSGIMYNLSSGESTQYLLDAGDTLVFITSPTKIDTATIGALVNSLVKQS